MKIQNLTVGVFLTSLTLVLTHGCAGPSVSQLPGEVESDREGESSAEVSASNSATLPPPALASDAQTVRIGSIDWYVKYDDALADAKRTHRPVWLHFGENPG